MILKKRPLPINADCAKYETECVRFESLIVNQDADFLGLVTSAYHALYDLVELRTHPLGALLLSERESSPKERGWQLHNLLLDAITQLDPGPQAPMYSKEWRRHQLMVLRYVDGQEAQNVAEQLAISRRQYYREHGLAMAATAEILRGRSADTVLLSAGEGAETGLLLRSEFDRVSGNEHTAQLGDVTVGVLQLLAALLHEHHIQVAVSVPPDLPMLSINGSVLRQLLLTILGAVATHCNDATLTVKAVFAVGSVRLTMTIDPAAAEVASAVQAQLAPYRDILRSSGIGVSGLDVSVPLREIVLTLPPFLQTSVLVIDDNQDVLELYERYLTPNEFQVTAASDAETALELATRLRPALIIIDLMMPQTDGWELLRRLRLDPGVAAIPVVICSVLKQRELALALGAQAYLEKPITEQNLLETIRAVLG